MSLALRYAARSDRGLIREANEDSVYAGPRLLAVADGMGGMAAGEVASNIAIATLSALDEDAPGSDIITALRHAIDEANSQMRDATRENPELEGMGTTLTALLFTGNRLALMHVGDSRAYVWREGELTQITHDDTYVQMLVDEGRLTPEEAHTHPQRSLLTRALDGRDVEPDSSIRPARVGDRYLLCSDGLSGVVSASTIEETLSIPDPAETVDRLISLALRGGGPDNITCIVADIVEAEEGVGDTPIVAGAAAHDRGKSTAATPDSAAGRAALATKTAEPVSVDADEHEPESSDPPQRARRTGLFVTLGAICLIVGAVVVGGWYYTQQQYYVGTTSDNVVAIFRGVHGSVAGIKFSSVEQTSSMRLDQLPPVLQEKVRETIWAETLGDAEEQLSKLRESRLPLCSRENGIHATTDKPGINCRA